jgi:GntR family transcriptional regulator/MocR family aminotransferase
VAARLGERRIAIRGLASYSLSPQPPALVVGYGRLPLAAIDAAVEALATAIGSP